MRRKKLKLFDWIMWLVAIIVSIGIGGLFINGAFMNVIILSWLPLIIHQIVGWLIIGTTIWALIRKFI